MGPTPRLTHVHTHTHMRVNVPNPCRIHVLYHALHHVRYHALSHTSGCAKVEPSAGSI